MFDYLEPVIVLFVILYLFLYLSFLSTIKTFMIYLITKIIT